MLSQVKLGEKTVTMFGMPWYYAEMLDWVTTIIDGRSVVKAFPKRSLSDKAFKEISRAFKRLGGAYVRRNGVAYFELVLEPRVASTPVAVGIKRAYEELEKET